MGDRKVMEDSNGWGRIQDQGWSVSHRHRTFAPITGFSIVATWAETAEFASDQCLYSGIYSNSWRAIWDCEARWGMQILGRYLWESRWCCTSVNRFCPKAWILVVDMLYRMPLQGAIDTNCNRRTKRFKWHVLILSWNVVRGRSSCLLCGSSFEIITVTRLRILWQLYCIGQVIDTGSKRTSDATRFIKGSDETTWADTWLGKFVVHMSLDWGLLYEINSKWFLCIMQMHPDYSENSFA